MHARLSLVVGIATAGRREQLTRTLLQLAGQTRLPESIVVCPAQASDLDPSVATALPCPLDVVQGPRGLCAQRNAILDTARTADVVLFIDDDFYPAPDYLAELARIFEGEPDTVVVTGSVIADGASGPGIAHDEALALLARPASRVRRGARETYGGYGCNFAIRMAPVRRNALRFDENLPMYGWLEDIDFSRQASRYGRVLRHPRLRGVHLGAKGGRTSGVRLGYSQLANPIYMMRKGTLTLSYGLEQMLRNVCANLLGVLAPEPWVDRRGRLRGNALALRDYVGGTLDPRNILQLE